MKINKTLTALIAGASLGLSGQVLATTAATTSIKNTASLSFKVNGSDVSELSTEAEFTVDSKVNMTLQSNDDPTSEAGTNETLSFTLTNLTNGPMYFLLAGGSGYTATTTPSNATLTIDLIYLDKEGDAITFEFDESIPNDATDTSTIEVEVTATATDDSKVTITTNNAADKDNNLTTLFYVLADNGDVNYDAIYEATSTITVSSASLTSTKAVTVKEDGMGTTGRTDTKLAIPGAIVTYSVLIQSDGTKDATGVIFSDVLPATLDPESVNNIVVYANDGITPLDLGPLITNYTVPSDASTDPGNTPGTVEIALPDITTGTQLTVEFDVTIL